MLSALLIFVQVIDLSIGLRLTEEEELQGCDLIEHGVQNDSYSRSMGDQLPHDDMFDTREVHDIEMNGNGIGLNNASMANQIAFVKEFMQNCRRLVSFYHCFLFSFNSLEVDSRFNLSAKLKVKFLKVSLK